MGFLALFVGGVGRRWEANRGTVSVLFVFGLGVPGRRQGVISSWCWAWCVLCLALLVLKEGSQVGG